MHIYLHMTNNFRQHKLQGKAIHAGVESMVYTTCAVLERYF